MFKIISRNKVKIVLAALLWFSALGVYHTHKTMPEGTDYLSKEFNISEKNVQFLYDLTYRGNEGDRIHQQEIYDAFFKYVDEAEQYILIDMFLFNSYGADPSAVHRKLADELTDRLINKKEVFPEIRIDLVTDPINTVYGGGGSRQLERLKQAGVNVIITDLTKLRDSNFLYSPFWRTFFSLFGNSSGGWIRHPFSPEEPGVSLRSYLTMVNFKANHRKVLVADNNGEAVSMIASANAHDGSSAHSNVALAFRGALAEEIYYTESLVARMSGGKIAGIGNFGSKSINDEGSVSLRVATERKIKDILLEEIGLAGPEDKIKIAQFYMSDREIIKSLLSASERGVDVSLVLDPNKDAFGYEKNGIPNRQVGRELVEKSGGKIKVRWYDTSGEQFHAKMTVIEKMDSLSLIIGSANLTRRNLENYNLELNALAVFPADSQTANEILSYYSRIWSNEGGVYTVDYEKFKDDSRWKMIVYRIQEAFGLSSF